jgi:hypothetical protein
LAVAVEALEVFLLAVLVFQAAQVVQVVMQAAPFQFHQEQATQSQLVVVVVAAQILLDQKKEQKAVIHNSQLLEQLCKEAVVVEEPHHLQAMVALLDHIEADHLL